MFFFFSSRRRHTRCGRDWSSDVCSSDLNYDNEAHIELFKYHLDLYDKYVLEEPMIKRPLQRFFKIYIRNIENASNLRSLLVKTKETSEMRKLIKDFEDGKLNDDIIIEE